MAIKTDELQTITTPQAADTILLANSAGSTAQLSMAQAAAFFGAEMVKTGNPVGAALSSKAAISAQQTVEFASVPSREVEVAAADLAAYIAGLPRLLTETLTITVLGGTTSDNGIYIFNFYGSGNLTIKAKDDEDVFVKTLIGIKNCSVPITVERLTFNNIQSQAGTIFGVVNTQFVTVNKMHLSGDGKANQFAFGVHYGTMVLTECSISNYSHALLSSTSTVNLNNCTGSNNIYGIQVEGGGIVGILGTTPELIGGSTNIKCDGLIIKSGSILL